MNDPSNTLRASPLILQNEEDHSGPVEQPGAAVSAIPDELLVFMQILREQVNGLTARLDQLAEAVDLTTRQVTFLPPQVRNLSSKVDRAVEAIGESRYQSLLLRLLGIYDLVCQMKASKVNAEFKLEQSTSNYLVLHTQLRQLLEANGLSGYPDRRALRSQLAAFGRPCAVQRSRSGRAGYGSRSFWIQNRDFGAAFRRGPGLAISCAT